MDYHDYLGTSGKFVPDAQNYFKIGSDLLKCNIATNALLISLLKSIKNYSTNDATLAMMIEKILQQQVEQPVNKIIGMSMDPASLLAYYLISRTVSMFQSVDDSLCEKYIVFINICFVTAVLFPNETKSTSYLIQIIDAMMKNDDSKLTSEQKNLCETISKPYIRILNSSKIIAQDGDNFIINLLSHSQVSQNTKIVMSICQDVILTTIIARERDYLTLHSTLYVVIEFIRRTVISIQCQQFTPELFEISKELDDTLYPKSNVAELNCNIPLLGIYYGKLDSIGVDMNLIRIIHEICNQSTTVYDSCTITKLHDSQTIKIMNPTYNRPKYQSMAGIDRKVDILRYYSENYESRGNITLKEIIGETETQGLSKLAWLEAIRLKFIIVKNYVTANESCYLPEECSGRVRLMDNVTTVDLISSGFGVNIFEKQVEIITSTEYQGDVWINYARFDEVMNKIHKHCVVKDTGRILQFIDYTIG